ncbi:MAG: hypothetical protein WCI55_12580 [Armatimonadota bacterium]
MGRYIIRVVCTAGIALLGTFANAQGLTMSIQQVWSGLESSQPNPYYANIENLGPNTTGVISPDETGARVSIDYQVELPSGTKKRVLFLSGGYNAGKVTLRSPAGVKEASIKVTYNSEQTRFGLISDNPSDLIFVKSQPSGEGDPSSARSAIGVGGCTPDDAPDRAFGYSCLDGLVLGDGTEKLRDSQVDAIKFFVRSGGSLAFIGGAAQSASLDPRWKELIPVSKTQVVTKEGLTELLGAPRLGSVEVKVSKGTCFSRSYGAGIVSILSVNPFESPVRESEDRRAIMLKAVRWNHKKSITRLVNEQIGQRQEEYGYGSSTVAYSSGFTGVTSPTAATRYSGTYNDPYQIKPPSLANIMWILIIYAIAVVPLNFLVLKKLNKMEFAWVSTPTISVIFSLVLLNSTIGLYKASATTRTTAVAILGENSEDSVVYGRSEMFFPRAKSYDLELRDVESIISGNYMGNSDGGDLNLKDDGRHLIAPDVQSANLAFKEFAYMQTSKDLKGLEITLVNQNGEPHINIVNQSHANILQITIWGTGAEQMVSDPIKSGSSRMIPVGKIIRSKLNKEKPDSVTGWQQFAANLPNKIVVLTSIDTMAVGPKYGAGHPASQYMVASVPQWRETR